MESFWSALYKTGDKMYTALLTWGIGLFLMTAYCYLVYRIHRTYGEFYMLVAGLLFLCAAFFFIDAWWTYKKVSSYTE